MTNAFGLTVILRLGGMKWGRRARHFGNAHYEISESKIKMNLSELGL